MAIDNPDQRLIRGFEASGGVPLTIDSNPMAVALGATLMGVDANTGTATLRFAPEALFVQGTGVLQGGAVTAMLDFAMAFAVLAALPDGQSCATVNLATAFLRAAPRGRYVAVAEIERRGRQLAFTRARLAPEDAPDTAVATATSTLVIVA